MSYGGLSAETQANVPSLGAAELCRAQHTATLGAMHQRAAADQARVRPGS